MKPGIIALNYDKRPLEKKEKSLSPIHKKGLETNGQPHASMEQSCDLQIPFPTGRSLNSLRSN